MSVPRNAVLLAAAAAAVLLLPSPAACVTLRQAALEERVVASVRRLLLDPLPAPASLCGTRKKVGGKQYPKMLCADPPLLRKRCAVLAVGARKLSHMKFDFDMVKKQGCRVASFDPFVSFTDKDATVLAEGFTFYKAGLSDRREVYTPRNSTARHKMDTLDGLVAMSHLATEARFDMVKLDCEGCEWRSFHQMLADGSSLLGRVSQLAMELHFEDSKERGPFNQEHYASMMKLLDRHGFCPYHREGHSCPMRWSACSPPNSLFERRFRNESFLVHQSRPLVRSWFELAWVKVPRGTCPLTHWVE